MKFQTATGSLAAPYHQNGRSGSLTAIANGNVFHCTRPITIKRYERKSCGELMLKMKDICRI